MLFGITIVILLVFVLAGFFVPETLSGVTSVCFNFITKYAGWLYLWSVLLVFIFSVAIAISRHGKIRLGDDDDRPEYSLITWFAMLFSAGMGIGLVFWGVAEPISHYMSPPGGISPASEQSMIMAFRFSFLHWGFHPWAVYAVMGLGLGYSAFRKKRPFLVSSILQPILGKRTEGPIGGFVDVVTLLVTVFGVAASLGMGALQINSGLNTLFGLPNRVLEQIIIIALITIIFIADASTGLNKGIKFFSNLNIAVASFVFLYMLFAGPTLFIVKTFFSSLAGYVKDFLPMSIGLASNHDEAWLGGWTIFYWAWWISWGPFVGTFIARISKGRTIREYTLGVLVAPAAFCLAWFAVFGGTAIDLELSGTGIGKIIASDVATGIFAVLAHMPLGAILSFIVIILLITFFITSADSAIFVIGMFASRGNLNPGRRIVVISGILISLTAIVFLYNGGLQAIQNTSIVMALPFVLILFLICLALFKELRQDRDNSAGQSR
jgi:glycine betaine transporter